MKKLLILPAAAMLLGLGVAAGVSKAPVVEAKADSVSATEIDITGKMSLKASEGTMVRVPNWSTSGLGFSVELKFANPTSIPNNVVFYPRSNGVNLTTGVIYLADFETRTKDTVNNIKITRQTYTRVSAVDATEGWIRFDCLFAGTSVASGHEADTFDEVAFQWYGATSNPFSEMRNLQVISELKYVGDTPKLYSQTNTPGYFKAGYDEFPKIANWSTSGLGLSMEFKPSAEKDTLISLQNNSYGYLAGGGPSNGGNIYMYRANNSGNPVVGKLFTLEGGWYRYEAMFSDFTPIAGTEAETLAMVHFTQWEGASYNCKPDYRNVKIINRYSTDDETAVGAYADSFMSKTGAVCAADGSTNVANLNTKLAEAKAEYDAMNPQAKVLLTYSNKVVNATVKGKVDAANERFAYIYGKYSDVINFTALKLNRNNAKGLFTTFTSENNNMYFVAIAAAAVLPLAVLPFAKKKHQ